MRLLSRIRALCYLLSAMSYSSFGSSLGFAMTTGSSSSTEIEWRSTSKGGGKQSPQRPTQRGRKGKGKGTEVDTHLERDPRLSRNSQLLLAPQFRPSSVRCACCGEPGHHVQNCVKAIQERVARSAVDCVQGRHYPYLHGVWRCNWCGMHLRDEDVKKQCPQLYAREAARDADKHEKYGSPFTQWQ